MQVQATRLIHAYKQAPWRVQRQYIGTFLLAIISMSLVAALYLDLSARATLSGRQIQSLQFEITTIQRSNADLETELANLTSSSVMQARAIELGYRPVKPGELDYVFVPGYAPPEPTILLETVDTQPHSTMLPDVYYESLIEWFDMRIKTNGGLY